MKKSKGQQALIAIIIIILIIFGGGMGVFSVLKAIALKTTYQGTLSTEIFDETAEYADDSTFITINKDPNKNFVILNISDTHLSDYDYRLFTGELAIRDIKRLVKETQPDLITLSGDLVCAKSEYNSVKKLTEFMNSLCIPWAPVFGNHDGEAVNIDKNYLAEVMIGNKNDKNNYCLMKKGPNNLGHNSDDVRVGDYVINIVENGTNKVQSLIMMDSGRDQLTESQVKWYRQVMHTLKNKTFSECDVKSTLILHIPIAEYYLAYMEGYDMKTNKWIEPYKSAGAYGDCYEDVCCDKRKKSGEKNAEDKNSFSNKVEMVQTEIYQKLIAKYPQYNKREYEDYFYKYGVPVDNGIFDALIEYGTENVLCGHDHLNCFFAPFTYKGKTVNLIYSLKNGMGSGYKIGRNGGTLLIVNGNTVQLKYQYV